MPTARRELSVETIIDASVACDPHLSPDGRWVLWSEQPVTRTSKHPHGSIWVAPISANGSGRRFTRQGTHRDHHGRWAPDSRAFAFLSDRANPGVDELYLIHLDGGEAARLVSRTGTGITSFAWSPSGDRIAFIAADPTDQEVERRRRHRDDAQVYGERWSYEQLHLVAIDSGRCCPVAHGVGHVLEVAWSPRGDELAALVAPTPEIEAASQTRLHRIALASAIEQHPAREVGMCRNLSWIAGTTDRAERLVWAGWHEATPQSGSAIWTLAIGDDHPHLESRDATVCEIAIAPSVDGSAGMVMVADGLGTRLRQLDTEATIVESDGSILGASLLVRDGSSTLAMVRSHADEPPELWVMIDGEARQVSRHQSGWAQIDLACQEPFYWRARDGRVLDGLVLHPPGASRDPLPTIVLVHGGPYGRWANGFSGTPGNWGQWLATAGYRILMPNPRGGQGHGHAFAASVRGAVGSQDYLDVMDMVDAGIDRGLVAAERLGICGWSQGGFMSAWAITQTERFSAAIMGAGVSDWGMLTMDTDLPSFEAELGGSRPWDGPGPHPAALRSPISFASQASTPLLILHGENDQRIPVGQAVGFARALRENGVVVEQVIYPREPHGPREREHVRDYHQRLRAWFDRWL